MFDDVGGVHGNVDAIPDDLHTGLFPYSYDIGARIYSISWGNTNNFYDLMASEIDEFSYKNPDFLVLVAVGNGVPAMPVRCGLVWADCTHHES